MYAQHTRMLSRDALVFCACRAHCTYWHYGGNINDSLRVKCTVCECVYNTHTSSLKEMVVCESAAYITFHTFQFLSKDQIDSVSDMCVCGGVSFNTMNVHRTATITKTIFHLVKSIFNHCEHLTHC